MKIWRIVQSRWSENIITRKTIILKILEKRIKKNLFNPDILNYKVKANDIQDRHKI